MARKSLPADPAQFGFDLFLAEAESINKAAAFERTHGHLPGTMEEALPFYRDLIARHHAAMLAAEIEAVVALGEEAAKLACKLNNGEPGILAGPDAPGCVLARESAAPDGTIPLWGQTGSFIITVNTMRVRIDVDGMFGIGARYMPWVNFSAREWIGTRRFSRKPATAALWGFMPNWCLASPRTPSLGGRLAAM